MKFLKNTAIEKGHLFELQKHWPNPLTSSTRWTLHTAFSSQISPTQANYLQISTSESERLFQKIKTSSLRATPHHSMAFPAQCPLPSFSPISLILCCSKAHIALS